MVRDPCRGCNRRESVNRSEFLALAAAAPLGLRTALTAPLPSALVTCDAEARLAVVDLGSFRVVRSIRTVADPRAVELVGGRAVVCHTAVGAVSIADSRGVRHLLRGLVEPRYVVAHPDGRHAFVTDSGRSSVTALDVTTGRMLGRVKLPGWARHLTIDHSGRRLWVSLGVDLRARRRRRHRRAAPYGHADARLRRARRRHCTRRAALGDRWCGAAAGRRRARFMPPTRRLSTSRSATPRHS